MSADLGCSVSTSSQNRRTLKKHERIPIVIVENHNEIVKPIHDEIRSKHLPLYGSAILHFDSHPDMLASLTMPADTVYNKQLLYEQLEIENWLLPLAYAGHLKKIVWIKPPWSNQMKDSSKQLIVGKDPITGTIRLNSKENYFVYERLYANEKQLINRKSFDFDVVTIGNQLNDGIDDYNRIELILNDIKDIPYILDIDLDYFATRNPFRLEFPKINMFERMRNLYKIPPPKENATDKEIYEFMDQRNKQINELNKMFKCLENNEPIPDDFKYRKELLEFETDMRIHYPYRIDWTLCEMAGITSDDTELPHHETTPDQLKVMYESFEKFLVLLKSIPPPTIITISRSYEDNYTTDNVDEIEAAVIDILQKNLNCVNAPLRLERDDSSMEESESVEVMTMSNSSDISS